MGLEVPVLQLRPHFSTPPKCRATPFSGWSLHHRNHEVDPLQHGTERSIGAGQQRARDSICGYADSNMDAGSAFV